MSQWEHDLALTIDGSVGSTLLKWWGLHSATVLPNEPPMWSRHVSASLRVQNRPASLLFRRWSTACFYPILGQRPCRFHFDGPVLWEKAGTQL